MAYKPVHIAIIDDGVNQKLYNIGELAHNIEITLDLTVCDRADYDTYAPSHGTTCAAIIRKYAPFALLSSVKILDGNARGMCGQLIKALEWCVDNGIRVVNVSLGTVVYTDFPMLRKAINFAYSKGLIIVAACNNRNIFTYPASHPNVIGVKCDMEGILNLAVTPDFTILSLLYNDYKPEYFEILKNELEPRFSMKLDCYNIANVSLLVQESKYNNTTIVNAIDSSFLDKKIEVLKNINIPIYNILNKNSADKLANDIVNKLSSYAELGSV